MRQRRGRGVLPVRRPPLKGREPIVPRTDSRKALAPDPDEALRGEIDDSAASAARRRTPLFIVASPRPQVGKTFLARLLTDFLRLDGDTTRAFQLEPGAQALQDYLPELTVAADLGDIRGQMALFDQLIVDDEIGKVVDVGTAAYARFFAIMEEISFVTEAQRRAIEPMILFAADPHKASILAYANLQRRFPNTLLVPVFNDAIVKERKIRNQFPFRRAASVPLRIPLLAPGLKAQADQSRYSFADFHAQLPAEIPIGLAFELRSWTKRAFLEFRELELRLLLEKLRAALPGVNL